LEKIVSVANSNLARANSKKSTAIYGVKWVTFFLKNGVLAMKLTALTLLLLSLSLARAQLPPNDACANAIVVDPKSPIPIYGNNTLAVLDGARERTCVNDPVADNGNGLWYKFTASALAGVLASSCNNGTDFDNGISVFVGNDCNSLVCVNSVGYSICDSQVLSPKVDFFTEPNQTYWILVHGFLRNKGFFHLTLSSSPTPFILLNSITDRRIDKLRDFASYNDLPSSRLNIQATFENPPKSVRVTFDNPPRNSCEKTPPFTIFGDLNGDYFNARIPVGEHLVTATPYNQTKCQGTAGPTQSQSFSLSKCSISVGVLDVAYNLSVGYNADTGGFYYLPCSLNFEVTVQCGFSPKEVKLELRNTVTNTLLVSRVERTAPYFVFEYVKGKPSSGALPPGEYSIKVIVDGIDMDDSSFVFFKKCAKNMPPNDACSNATSFALNASVPFQAIGDTTLAVLDNTRESICGSSTGGSGLWYKFRTPPAPFFSKIVASTCSSVTNFVTRIRVFVGDDCGLLSCLYTEPAFSCDNAQGSSVTFLGEPNVTYRILVSGSYFQSGMFQLSVESNSNVFLLVNPISDSTIGLLQGMSYFNLPVSSLNIQAVYDPALPAPRSVRLTFDNPARNVCDQSPPFSVFGDMNGDYFNATIPVGNHTVTATPYNGANCGGVAGLTRSESFFLAGCAVVYNVFTVNPITLADDIVVQLKNYEATSLDYLPCSVNIQADITCGFQIKKVNLKLFDTVADKLLVSRIERTYPYVLFGGTYIKNGKALGGQIPPGKYNITATVDGTELESAEFFVLGDCVP
jgi:hypothetical protein